MQAPNFEEEVLRRTYVAYYEFMYLNDKWLFLCIEADGTCTMTPEKVRDTDSLSQR